jgi:hypothetical protein
LHGALRTGSIAVTRPIAGYFAAVTQSQILQNMINLPRNKKNAIIVEGLLDPSGFGKNLSKPMPPSDLNGWRKVYSRVLPGIIAGETRSNEPTPKPTYAKGGPVYTHPDISSIRAKRAVRSLAK